MSSYIYINGMTEQMVVEAVAQARIDIASMSDVEVMQWAKQWADLAIQAPWNAMANELGMVYATEMHARMTAAGIRSKNQEEKMKPIAITPAAIIAMIEEVNEHITAVSATTIDHVVTTIRDSIHEDAEVTEAQIHDIVSYWILRNHISADVMLKAARSIEEDMAEEPEVYGESWAWEVKKYRAIAELVA